MPPAKHVAAAEVRGLRGRHLVVAYAAGHGGGPSLGRAAGGGRQAGAAQTRLRVGPVRVQQLLLVPAVVAEQNQRRVTGDAQHRLRLLGHGVHQSGHVLVV